MDINFEYYKIFYYVAKYKNITRAAAALGSNQPNVTRVMKLLEEGLVNLDPDSRTGFLKRPQRIQQKKMQRRLRRTDLHRPRPEN